MLLDHLTPILEKTAALRARLNQIDTLVGVTDTQIKENELTPQEIAELETNFESVETEIDECSLDDSISNIETILGI